MSEHREFTIKQIVWASVKQYPAWPAKIVKKLNVNGKTAYKVNFFGDPTYCYLHADSLQLFNCQQTEQQLPVEQNLKLKRAFELAKFSISKQYDHISNINNQPISKVNQMPNLPTAFEQTRIQSKECIDLPQKIQQEQSPINTEMNFGGLSLDSISISNVIDILESYNKGEIAQRLGNLKRKQIICFQNHLKQNLLLKYKLNAIDFLKQSPKHQQTISNPVKQVRTIRKQKKKGKQSGYNQKQRCLRRIQKILYQKGMQRHLSYRMTLKIMQQIQRRSNIQNKQKTNQQKSRKQNFIHTLYQISSNIQQIKGQQVQYIEKNILSLIEMQFHSNKLEQGSRMTQINQEFVV